MSRNYTSGVEEMQALHGGIKQLELDYKSVQFELLEGDNHSECNDWQLQFIGTTLSDFCTWLGEILSSWPNNTQRPGANHHMNIIDELEWFKIYWKVMIVNSFNLLNLPTCVCMVCGDCRLQAFTVRAKTYLQWMADIISTWYKPQVIANEKVRRTR